ncbi:hypothetical protein [Pseudorhodoplanes sp.]|uniref:hypothetical protein n=1 Tax=Pseudorhodoplanes sp. TaxID=1934341 RepID=UPI00391BCA57
MMTRVAVAVVFAGLLGLAAPAAAQPQSHRGSTDTFVESCVFSRGAGNCVQQYRYAPRNDNAAPSLREPSAEDVAELRDRERRWADRCRPQLRADMYGVNRYVYAARGCEFGRDRD